MFLLSARTNAVPSSINLHNFALDYQFIFTRGQSWPSGIVVAPVRVCVRQSRACQHDNSSTVLARITKFEIAVHGL